MGIFGEDLSAENWDTCSSQSSFSGSRSCTFSNAGSHKYDHSQVNFQGIFFSDQNWTVDEKLALLETV